MSMIIGRRQIILAVLVVALGAAIFLNWRFTQDSTTQNLAGAVSQSNLGDAAYVANQNLSTKVQAYFSTARLQRTQARDQAKQDYQTIYANPTSTDKQKTDAQTSINQLAANVQTEMAIENTVKAKGFADCFCVINAGKVNVAVPPKTSTNLTASESAQIFDIVIAQTKIAKDNITIINVN